MRNLAAEVDSTVTFDEVVLVGGETTKVGAPLVAGATVTAKVVAQGKGKKSQYLNTNLKRTITVN